MSLPDINAITNVLASHAMGLGHFETVNLFQSRTPIGQGLRASVWFQSIRPTSRRSGLASVSAQLIYQFRIYQHMMLEPYDMIDPLVITATAELMEAYSGDFDLGGTVANIDIFGAHGQPLDAIAGYLEIDGGLNRIMDIDIPLILNDVWTEAS